MLNHLRFINRRPDRVTLPGPRRVAIQCTTVHVLPLPWTLWQLLHNGAGRDRLCEIVSPDFLVHTYPLNRPRGVQIGLRFCLVPPRKLGNYGFLLFLQRCAFNYLLQCLVTLVGVLNHSFAIGHFPLNFSSQKRNVAVCYVSDAKT